jgi:hypothetical protein
MRAVKVLQIKQLLRFGKKPRANVSHAACNVKAAPDSLIGTKPDILR